MGGTMGEHGKALAIIRNANSELANAAIGLRDLSDYFEFFIGFVTRYLPLLGVVLETPSLREIRPHAYNFHCFIDDILSKKLNELQTEQFYPSTNENRLEAKRRLLLSPGHLERLTPRQTISAMLDLLEPHAKLMYAHLLRDIVSLAASTVYLDHVEADDPNSRMVVCANMLNSVLSHPAFIDTIFDEDDIAGVESLLSQCHHQSLARYENPKFCREQAFRNLRIDTLGYTPTVRPILLESSLLYWEIQRALAAIKMVKRRDPSELAALKMANESIRRIFGQQFADRANLHCRIDQVAYSIEDIHRLLASRRAVPSSFKTCAMFEGADFMLLEVPATLGAYVGSPDDVSYDDICSFHAHPAGWICRHGILPRGEPSLVARAGHIEQRFEELAGDLSLERLVANTFAHLPRRIIGHLCRRGGLQVSFEFVVVFAVVSNIEEMAKLAGVTDPMVVKAAETVVLTRVPPLVKRLLAGLSEADIQEKASAACAPLEERIHEAQQDMAKTLDNINPKIAAGFQGFNVDIMQILKSETPDTEKIRQLTRLIVTDSVEVEGELEC